MSDNEQHAGADAYKLNFIIDSDVNPDFSHDHQSSLTAPLLRDYEVISNASTIPNLEHVKSTEHEFTGNLFNRLLI